MRKFTVVALDESDDWTQPELVERSGGAIYTLYAFDPEERTHVCEMTPSYWLVPFDIVPKGYPADDNEWENLYDELQLGFIDGCEATYVHCHRIDALKDEFKRTEEFDDDSTLDDATEKFRGNGTVPESASRRKDEYQEASRTSTQDECPA